MENNMEHVDPEIVEQVVDTVDEVAKNNGGFLVNAGKCVGLMVLGGIIAEGGRRAVVSVKKKLADRKASKEQEEPKTDEEDIDQLIPDELPDIGED